MGGKARARQGRKYWARVVAKFERRGLSHDAFCEAENLNVGTFRSWLYKIRHDAAAEAPSFVEVVETGGVATATCVVRVGDVALEFREAPEAAYVTELLIGLDSRTR